MKNILQLTLGVAFSAFLVSATNHMVSSQKWNIDKAHSAITFSVKHMFTPVEGRFQSYQENFLFDPENLSESSVDLSIDVSSVNTQEAKRDKHLQSADFFDASTFSKIKFSATRFEKKNEGNYIAYGQLTIKDVTKDLALPFQVLGTTDHPMMKGAKVMGISAQATINRGDFGVGTGSWAATMVVGEMVTININLEAVTQ